ncbi:hypothetical protein THC_0895 [Caldimicrobium thiodismutans]|uniref:DUF948 domain-containing protein n=1 Tax=Caldimicrobium thiodismutans TaxID=1653476 RepID=A0A0U5B5D1_9BACT|nr:hypothetical protein [Caldimicrobium thiodismutans]BAU23280.1 hypothetical protein THC_0895 [Caldimicrobium thiodismutans]
MENIVYIFLGLTILFVFIVLIGVLKLIQTLKNLNQNLELLPPVLLNLKNSSEKLQENLEVSKSTLENLNHLLSELKIVPRIVGEIGASIKDFEAFLKGQVEVVKDDLHFSLEDLREILKDFKGVSLEVSEKTKKLSQSLDPVIKGLSESAQTGAQLLENFNTTLKKTYIEVSAMTTGVSEVLRGLRRIIKI